MHLAHEVPNIAMTSPRFRSAVHIFRNACGQLMSLQPEEVDFLFWLSTCAFALIKQILSRAVVPSRISFEGRRS